MIPWSFLAFTVIFLALVCAHFLFAYRAWRTSRGGQSSEIDPNYVRIEDYFARSFRIKVAEWIQLPVHAALPGDIMIIKKGRELVRRSGSARYPDNTQSDEILVVQGTLECGFGCVFKREIYVREDARIGGGSKLQAIAADGNLSLGPSVHIARWVDCKGELDIGINSVVPVRATAGKTIRLREGAQVGSAVAPRVCTGDGELIAGANTVMPPIPEIEFPGSAAKETGAGNPAMGLLDLKKVRKLSADCWMYLGDFNPDVPLRVTTKLIVKGDCILRAGSLLEGDLKADGRIDIGAQSVCRGNVVAGGAIRFAPECRFYGVVHAGKTLWLSSGVRGGEATAQTAAYSAEILSLECGVAVHGKLASGDRLVVEPKAKH